MARPYWMNKGKINEAGVPTSMLDSNTFRTRQDVKRHMRKRGEEKDILDWIKKHPGKLTPIQKRMGARKIA